MSKFKHVHLKLLYVTEFYFANEISLKINIFFLNPLIPMEKFFYRNLLKSNYFEKLLILLEFTTS